MKRGGGTDGFSETKGEIFLFSEMDFTHRFPEKNLTLFKTNCLVEKSSESESAVFLQGKVR